MYLYIKYYKMLLQRTAIKKDQLLLKQMVKNKLGKNLSLNKEYFENLN